MDLAKRTSRVSNILKSIARGESRTHLCSTRHSTLGYSVHPTLCNLIPGHRIHEHLPTTVSFMSRDVFWLGIALDVSGCVRKRVVAKIIWMRLSKDSIGKMLGMGINAGAGR